jgi:hypothetical protein
MRHLQVILARFYERTKACHRAVFDRLRRNKYFFHGVQSLLDTAPILTTRGFFVDTPNAVFANKKAQ